MRTLSAILVAAALFAGFPASGAMARGESGAGGGAVAVAARHGVTVTTRTVGSYGRVLVDGRGLPLYYFTRDRGTSSRCYGTCAATWPVTFAQGRPVARGAVKPGLLGRRRRSDGRFQATYAGHALYSYVGDRPGVALCHDVREFGGVWLLLRAGGQRV
jgi:predicted lipoprotein with Yx(FWY)xxD motif